MISSDAFICDCDWVREEDCVDVCDSVCEVVLERVCEEVDCEMERNGGNEAGFDGVSDRMRTGDITWDPEGTMPGMNCCVGPVGIER